MALDNSGCVQLLAADSGAALPWPVRLVTVRQQIVELLTPSGKNVAVGPQGKLHNHGGHGPWARWEMLSQAGPAGQQLFALRSIGHAQFLAVSADMRSTPLSPDPVWLRTEAAAGVTIDDAGAAPAAPPPPVDPTVLSDADKQFFKEQGYVIVRNAVPPHLVAQALHAINHQLGKPDCWEPDPNPQNAAQLVLKLPRGADGIGAGLLDGSPRFWSALNILLGVGNVEPWSVSNRSQQVALRFPRDPAQGSYKADTRPGTRYHIDGMNDNKLCPFTILAGVALSSQPRPEMGNLHVFPGSHLDKRLHAYYRDRINDDSQNELDDSKPDLGESVQVLLEPGDVVLAHQLLAHRLGINTSEHIRYQLYYRVHHKNHATVYKDAIIDNPFLEFDI